MIRRLRFTLPIASIAAIAMLAIPSMASAATYPTCSSNNLTSRATSGTANVQVQLNACAGGSRVGHTWVRLSPIPGTKMLAVKNLTIWTDSYFAGRFKSSRKCVISLVSADYQYICGSGATAPAARTSVYTSSLISYDVVGDSKGTISRMLKSPTISW